ncbi:hypothetical protein ACHWQZ_G016703 [Mnemiopsis leidyi]
MENPTLLVAAVFIFLLALCLVGLFVHLVGATRSDNKNTIQQLKRATLKIQQLENASERTFGEFEHLLDHRLRFMFVQMRKKTLVSGTQTDLEIPEVVRREAECQTDFVKLSDLPPLEVTFRNPSPR